MSAALQLANGLTLTWLSSASNTGRSKRVDAWKRLRPLIQAS